MLRRSLVLLSKATTNTPNKRRTIVRDPRKVKKIENVPVAVTTTSSSTQNQSLPSLLEEQRQQQNDYNNKLKISSPFQPASTDNDNQPQSIGSTLASYMLAGVGVAMGATLVGVLFGGL
ncbi:MAG: hypothetical protein ACI8RD_001013 [Bacillariaceae sp.]|jgi:hypothetical protein